MSVSKIPFTKTGFEKIQKDLEDLISKRPDAVKALTRGREMGDLSENGLYRAAKQALNDIDRDIRHLKYLVKSADIEIPQNNETIQIGHEIIIETENLKKDFFIVGEFEANPAEFKISNKSPIGFALMGRKVGDEVKINTPIKTLIYKILSIS